MRGQSSNNAGKQQTRTSHSKPIPQAERRPDRSAHDGRFGCTRRLVWATLANMNPGVGILSCLACSTFVESICTLILTPQISHFSRGRGVYHKITLRSFPHMLRVRARPAESGFQRQSGSANDHSIGELSAEILVQHFDYLPEQHLRGQEDKREQSEVSRKMKETP